MNLQLQSLLGVALLLALCWLSGTRQPVHWRVVISGLLLQFALALVLIELPQSRELFVVLNRGMLALEEATAAGTSMVFGYLGGGDPPFETRYPHNSFILAFRSLPLILVVGALSALLFYWRVLPLIVRGFSWFLNRAMGISGPLGVGTAANIFLGMVEAPLLVRPYLLRLHRGELFALMVCGMATVAGTVLVLYASILTPVISNPVGHVMSASLISAPAALTLASLFHPWPANPQPLPPLPAEYQGAMDAITTGTARGLHLLLHIIAMLVVLVALVALVNQLLALLPGVAGAPLTLERMAGWLFAPLAWSMGIPWREAVEAGQLLGIKVILNELIAFLNLAGGDYGFSERSAILLSYALCGFANLGSLGIMLGGLTAMVPERKSEIIALGFPSVWVGLLSTILTAAVVGTLL